MAATVPPALKAILPYIRIANEHESKDSVIAYWCRYFALDTGLKISKEGDARAYLLGLMDQLETMKKENASNEAFTNDLVAQSHIESYAITIFTWADQQDRNSNFDKKVIRAFHASGYIFDVLSNFGEVNEEVARMSKYAKWKAAYIYRCLKEGTTPVPGPMKGDDDGDLGGGGMGATGGGGFQPPTFQNDLPPAPPADPAGGSNLFDMRDIDMGLPQVPQQPAQIPPSNPGYPSMPPPQVHPHSAPAMHPPGSGFLPPGMAPIPPNMPAPPPAPGLSIDQMQQAQKYCKYANSALTYEDVPTAVQNLHKALILLTTGVDQQA